MWQERAPASQRLVTLGNDPEELCAAIHIASPAAAPCQDSLFISPRLAVCSARDSPFVAGRLAVCSARDSPAVLRYWLIAASAKATGAEIDSAHAVVQATLTG
jgi:hypothetical protein